MKWPTQLTVDSRMMPVMIGACAGLTLLIGTLARTIPALDSLWVLVVLPIGLVAWFTHWGWGVVLALLSLLPGLMFPVLFESGAGALGAVEPAIRFLLLAGAGLIVSRVSRANSHRQRPGTPDATGFANAGVLFDMITAEVERGQRYGRPFTIAYVGMDNLAAVRLRSGMRAAEGAIQTAAQQIRGSIRTVDHVAILRDHEFALLLPETGHEAASIVLNRMRRVLEQAFGAEKPPITFTIGAITWLQSNLAPDQLHQRTYQLMYGARRDGLPLKHEVLQQLPGVEKPEAMRGSGRPSRRVAWEEVSSPPDS
jgi:diguanylate cyclase (GGDEF)-like protein